MCQFYIQFLYRFYNTKLILIRFSYSLFNGISKFRTCQDAEIVSHWCTCQQSKPIESNNIKVVSAAKFAVNNMNLQLKGYAQCATLVLDDIISARILTHDSEHITNEKSIKDYTITLRTIPGDGVFEVSTFFVAIKLRFSSLYSFIQ